MAARASAIVIQQEKILVLHRKRGGEEFWCFPGGSIEEGETIDEALDRELKEETSLDAVDKKYLFTVVNNGRDEHHYLVTECTGELRLGGEEAALANEMNQYIFEWVSLFQFNELAPFYPQEAKEKIIALLS